jgi:hypothetical protein
MTGSRHCRLKLHPKPVAARTDVTDAGLAQLRPSGPLRVLDSTAMASAMSGSRRSRFWPDFVSCISTTARFSDKALASLNAPAESGSARAGAHPHRRNRHCSHCRAQKASPPQPRLHLDRNEGFHRIARHAAHARFIARFGFHRRCRYLDISGTQRTDSGLWSITLTSEGVEAIAAVTDLVELNLGGTAISASGLKTLRSLAKLDRLTLQGCKTVGHDAVPVLSSWTRLRWLDVAGTQLTPEDVATLKKALPRMPDSERVTILKNH